MSEKSLQYFRSLPYTRKSEFFLEPKGKAYWLASIEELPGCKTDGATLAEAVLNLDSLFDDYIEAKLGWGSRIPEPEVHRGKDISPITLLPGQSPQFRDLVQYQEIEHEETARAGAPVAEYDSETESRAVLVAAQA